VGTFAQRGLAASQLNHCGTPVPITRDAAIPQPLFTLATVLGYCHCGCSPRAPCSSLAWLSVCRCMARCCLRPRGVGGHLSLACLPHGLRSVGRDRHYPKIHTTSRGYVSDSELHSSPRHTCFPAAQLTLSALHYRALDQSLPGRASGIFPLSLSTYDHCQVNPTGSPSFSEEGVPPAKPGLSPNRQTFES